MLIQILAKLRLKSGQMSSMKGALGKFASAVEKEMGSIERLIGKAQYLNACLVKTDFTAMLAL